jgi:hypothetical protein
VTWGCDDQAPEGDPNVTDDWRAGFMGASGKSTWRAATEGAGAESDGKAATWEGLWLPDEARDPTMGSGPTPAELEWADPALEAER